jgi:hypothetical protein
MLVKVTENHIKKGVRKKADRCPIALALKDKGFWDVSVNGLLVSAVTPSGKIVKKVTSLPMDNFIHNFDSGNPVKPISFRMPS